MRDCPFTKESMRKRTERGVGCPTVRGPHLTRHALEGELFSQGTHPPPTTSLCAHNPMD